MVRFVVFLLLLAVGLWLLVSVYQAERDGRVFDMPGWANPSSDPLPVPWQGRAPLTIHGLDEAQRAPTACGPTYSVQPGDTLGTVARNCGIAVENLLAANPTITDPNRIEPGWQITIPVLAGRGGGDPLALEIGGGSTRAPGTTVTLRAAGFPPNQAVRVGLGLSESGFHIVGEGAADANGNILLPVTIPAETQRGQAAFFLVTTRGVPSVSAISEKFVVE